MTELVKAVGTAAGPVGVVALFWFLSDMRAMRTIDGLAASIVQLALSRAGGAKEA